MSRKPDPQSEEASPIAFVETKHGEPPSGYAPPEIRRVRDASGRQFILEIYHELHCPQLTDRADVSCTGNALMSGPQPMQ